MSQYLSAIEQLLQHANGHLTAGQRQQAMECYESILRMEETCQIQGVSADQRKEVLKKILELKPEIYFQIGDFHRLNGRLDQALPYLLKAAELIPGVVHFHLGLGRTYLAKELFKEAIGEFQEVLRLGQGNHEAEGHAYEGIGQVFVTQGRPVQNTVVWLQRAAECFEQAGLHDRARQVRANLRQIDPGAQPSAGQEPTTVRLRQVESALAEKPDDLALLNAQADCLVLLQRLSEAAATLEKVVRLLEAQQAQARLKLADIYRQVGR